MKHLLLFIFFSGSLDTFSQVPKHLIVINTDTFEIGKVVFNDVIRRPDTLRATLIVYYDRGPAILHTKPGFVVWRDDEIVYLDDKKKLIKAPWEVLTYKIKK